MSSISVVIFDLGKVIFDFDLRKFVSAFSKKTSKKGEDINKLIFEYGDLAASLETGKINSFDFYERIAKSAGYAGSYNEFCVIWNDIFTPMTETVEVLAMAARKNRLAVLSNTNELHFEYLKSRYPRIFLLFSDFHLSYRMGARKPEDKIYQDVIKYYGVSPDRLFFTDDIPENVNAAVKHGIKAGRFVCAQDLLRDMRKENIEI